MKIKWENIIINKEIIDRIRENKNFVKECGSSDDRENIETQGFAERYFIGLNRKEKRETRRD